MDVRIYKNVGVVLSPNTGAIEATESSQCQYYGLVKCFHFNNMRILSTVKVYANVVCQMWEHSIQMY